MVLLSIVFSLAGNVIASDTKVQEKPISEIGGEFSLHSFSGDVSLSDYQGKVVLLYFGYINCPDACPTTLSQWSKAFKFLSEKEASQVQGIMVSVDPERDTLAELDAFTDFFHDNIVGVSGSLEELKKVTQLYGTDFTIQPHQPGKNYGVDHSFHVFIINPQGEVKHRVDFTLPPKELAVLIQQTLKK